MIVGLEKQEGKEDTMTLVDEFLNSEMELTSVEVNQDTQVKGKGGKKQHAKTYLNDTRFSAG